MSMPSVQVVFFDAAGTLFQVQGSVAEIYLEHAERHGFKKTGQSLMAIKSAFGRAFGEAPPPVFAVSDPAAIKQSERLWWFDIVHNVFYRVGMFEGFDDFFEDVFQVFERPETWRLYPETITVLKRLKDEEYELGIISKEVERPSSWSKTAPSGSSAAEEQPHGSEARQIASAVVGGKLAVRMLRCVAFRGPASKPSVRPQNSQPATTVVAIVCMVASRTEGGRNTWLPPAMRNANRPSTTSPR